MTERPPGPAATDIGASVAALFATWRELAEVRVAILVAEARGAVHAAEMMLIAAVVAGLLLAWSWLLILAIAVGGLVRQGVRWEVAALVMIAVNLVAVALLYLVARNAARNITLAHTRAALAGRPSPPATESKP